MAKYGMAIDMHKCVGCGACALACKTENNTEFQHENENYNWADFVTMTEGNFAEGNLKHKVYPVLCNHCSDAPCVEVCPSTPKAMHKTEDGITMHNDDWCIGCQLCQVKCPYSTMDLSISGGQFSVISYNPYESDTQRFYQDESSIIAGATSTPKEIAQDTGIVPPDKNEYTHPDYSAVRPSDVTEKCIFCDHRIKNDELPHCVTACPSNARIFGDLDDSESDVSKAIAENGFNLMRDNSGAMLNPGEDGTKPNVYYLNDFTVGVVEKPSAAKAPKKLHVFPNPASGNVNAEFDMKAPGTVSFSLFNISGKKVLNITDQEFQSVGKKRLNFDVSNLKPGTYVGRLTTMNNAYTANIIVK